MKKYVIKMVALLIFASVAVSSCSLEYRQRHGRMHEHDNDHHDNDHHDNDHHYDQVHH